MSRDSAMALVSLPPTPAPEVTSTPAGEPGLQTAEPITEKPNLESTRFAHLAKKESQLQKDRETFKKEQETFTSERTRVQEVLKKAQTFEELKSKDPVAALKAVGFSDTDIFNLYAAQEDTSTPEEKAASAAQKVIDKHNEEQARKEAEATEKKNIEVMTEFRNRITAHLTADKDKYEYCNYHEAEAEQLIEETVSAVLTESNELINIQEAADMVESFYEERDKDMSSLKKRKPAPAPTPEVEDAPLKPEVSPRPTTKTLSSKTSASVASTTVTKRESPDQKKARIIAKYITKV